eukprot:13123288-Alexandrium_andersonii.AAC.1
MQSLAAPGTPLDSASAIAGGAGASPKSSPRGMVASTPAAELAAADPPQPPKPEVEEAKLRRIRGAHC